MPVEDDVIKRCALSDPMDEEEQKQFQYICDNIDLYVVIQAAFEEASRLGYDIEINLERKVRRKKRGNRRP